MSNVYIVNNTDGTLNIELRPGALNGPGGPQRDSDMRLYGSGALMWGEGVDENILRLTENFACHEKIGSPSGMPQDESDLGPGYGITVPVIGQTWYNKTDEQLYIYDGANWKKTSGVLVDITMPTAGQPGDMWYDLGAATGCGNPTLKIYDPSHPDQVDGWVAVTNDSVSGCGDTMSGDLDMSPNGGTTRFKILNVDTPTDDYDAANKKYVDDEIAGVGGSITGHVGDTAIHLTQYQNDFLDAVVGGCAVDTATAQLLGADLCELLNYSTTPGLTTVAADMANRVKKDGDTVTGDLVLSGPGHSNAPGIAATEAYVDAQVNGALGGADRNVRFFSSPATGQGQQDGDIHVSGTTVSVWAGGAWRQIFPAQYS